jgi:GntR family transcriptional regulator / MocR family aminotransferase
LRPRGAAAGLHLLVDLPPDIDESALVSAAEARGVGLDGLAPHTARAHPPAVILGYGRIAEPAIAPGVRALADAMGAVTTS